MNIPYFKQNTLYTCGAAVTRMVFDYYGIKKSEEELVRELRITPEQGMGPKKLCEFFSQCGFKVKYYTNSENPDASLVNLKKYLGKNIPVIALVNRLEYDTKTSFMNNKVEWEGSGFSYHYIVVTGIDESKVYFNDPHEEAGTACISYDNFLRAWFHNGIKGEMLSVHH